MSEPVLVKKCKIALVGAEYRALMGVSIYIEDGVIAYLGDNPPPGSKSGMVIDAEDLVAVPCTYNAHTHAAMVMLRGYYDDSELHDWLRRVWWVERHLTREVVRTASKLAVMEMLSHGVCGLVDMYFYPEEMAEVAEKMGIRALVGPVVMGSRVDPYRAAELVKGFAAWVAGRGFKLVKPVVNVHSVYAAPLEAVKEAAKVAHDLELPLHIHVSETKREVYEVKKRYGVFPFQLLDRIGALNANTIAVHAGWIASWELDLVAQRGATLVHCPSSNMKLATAGHFPLREALEKGINVALGTDSVATNNTVDLFREMRVTVLLQRHSYWDVGVKAVHALRAATQGGAKVLGLRKGGRIEVGSPGDLVLLDALSLRMQPLRMDNVVSMVVYSTSGSDVVYTIVGGRVSYNCSHLATWKDEAAKIAKHLNNFLSKLKEGEAEEPPCSPPEACVDRQ